MLLAASVSISWVFAKSIQNVSLLGAQYGLVGCAAYGECPTASMPGLLSKGNLVPLCTLSCMRQLKYGYVDDILSYCSVQIWLGESPTFWPHNLLVTPAAAYYTSFASVGIVIYVLRVRKGYRSLPEAINARYGPLASVAFGEWSVLSLSFPCLHL